jgi:hypothetical protein
MTIRTRTRHPQAALCRHNSSNRCSFHIRPIIGEADLTIKIGRGRFLLTKRLRGAASSARKTSDSPFHGSSPGSHFNCAKAKKSPRMKTRLWRRNSLEISKADIYLEMSEFDSSQGSQAVTQLKIVATEIAEVPAKCGLLQILFQSLYSKFPQSPSENLDSLWPKIEIIPVFGRRGPETGFDLHCAVRDAVLTRHSQRKQRATVSER